MLVQALGAKLAVERLDIRIVGRLPGSGEVQEHFTLIGPQLERDELAAIVHSNHLGIANLAADPFEGLHDIFTPLAEARMGVDNSQDAQLTAVGQLVMHEVHGPNLVGMGGFRSVLPKLGFHRSLRGLVSQL